jgi:hypothetical protein
VLDPSVPIENSLIEFSRDVISVPLSTITLKIFSNVAQFSYFPSNVGKDIDGSFEAIPLTG